MALKGVVPFPAETQGVNPQAPPISLQPSKAYTQAWIPWVSVGSPSPVLPRDCGQQGSSFLGGPVASAALRGRSHGPTNEPRTALSNWVRWGPAENSARKSLRGCLSAPQIPHAHCPVLLLETT